MSSAIKRGSVIQVKWSDCDVRTAKVSSKKKNGWLRACYLTPPKFAGQMISVRNSPDVVQLKINKFDDAHRAWVFKTLSEKLHRQIPKTLTELFQPDVMNELSIIWKNIDEDEKKKWNDNAIAWAQWLLHNN